MEQRTVSRGWTPRGAAGCALAPTALSLGRGWGSREERTLNEPASPGGAASNRDRDEDPHTSHPCMPIPSHPPTVIRVIQGCPSPDTLRLYFWGPPFTSMALLPSMAKQPAQPLSLLGPGPQPTTAPPSPEARCSLQCAGLGTAPGDPEPQPGFTCHPPTFTSQLCSANPGETPLPTCLALHSLVLLADASCPTRGKPAPQPQCLAFSPGESLSGNTERISVRVPTLEQAHVL